jgi:hypothetical protein
MKLDEIFAILRSLPSDTYRAGDADFERKRAKFYAGCAKAFEFEGWSGVKSAPYERFTGEPGRDGLGGQREKYGESAKASYWNHHAGTVETFERKSALLDSAIVPPYNNEKRDQAAFEGNTRRRVARKVRDLFEGEMVSAMKSADLEAVPGGSFGSRSPSDHALDCQAKVNEMRQSIPPGCMATLELVLRNEMFLWERKDRKDARAVLEEIRLALDFAAWSLGATDAKGRQEITKDELCRRWPEAGSWFWQQRLRPAIHSGRVISK